MEISLALILDEIGLDTEITIPKELNPKFRSVELFIPGETRFTPGKLFVCPLSEALVADGKEGAFFLCLRDKAAESDRTDTMAGITVIRGNVGLRELFNRVLRIFVRVSQWVIAMEQSVSNRKGLKDLLDLSEPIFGNFITIQDSTFKLVCYTEGIKSPSIVMSRLIKYGYHPPETMELFRKYRRLEQFKMITDVIVTTDKVTSDNDIVKKTIHLAGNILTMIVMDCCGKPANNATVEMFEILIDYIKRYADLEIAQTGGIGGIKALAIDILDRSAGSIEEARTRATYCGFPFDSDFRLYVFSFLDDNNVPTAHLIHLLSEVFTEAVVFSWRHHILIIEHGNDNIAETCKFSENTLGRTDFVCGISNEFGSLWCLLTAFEQAVVAKDISARLKNPTHIKNHERFYLFSDNLIYHIVSSSYRATPAVFDNSFISRSIATLCDYDEKHRTETARILRHFLENERSATATASIMHMHRNTVLYHMDKISSLLGLSLDDPDIRLQLLLAYKVHDFGEL
ncbi:MAG: helix-turn-helix domain-containing protein [Oscillospiraceae bacterium]|nr:helix-turn-helix domain-containing protein [Oscillospiraceae bacterium]